jgi:hypothetical protein
MRTHLDAAGGCASAGDGQARVQAIWTCAYFLQFCWLWSPWLDFLYLQSSTDDEDENELKADPNSRGVDLRPPSDDFERLVLQPLYL